MIRIATLSRLALAGACALSLGGCISLLPKTKPALLYRFGDAPAAERDEAPAAAAKVGVFKAGGLFQREAAGDRLLTVTGSRVAYIEGARWAAPAPVLFDAALLAAFDADPGPARMIVRGEPSRSKFVLRVDVRNFETVYDRGGKAAPQVLVRVHTVLIRSDRGTVDEEIFEARARAGDNRQGPIVQAYNRAVAETVGKVVDWTNAKVAAPEG